jgi:hypothetical protein
MELCNFMPFRKFKGQLEAWLAGFKGLTLTVPASKLMLFI